MSLEYDFGGSSMVVKIVCLFVFYWFRNDVLFLLVYCFVEIEFDSVLIGDIIWFIRVVKVVK